MRREDVVAGAVDDPGDAPDAVRHQPAADGVDDGDAAGDAPLEAERDALLLGPRHQLLPVRGEERLVGGDHVLAACSMAARMRLRAGSMPPMSSTTTCTEGSSTTALASVVNTAGDEPELARPGGVEVGGPHQLERHAEPSLDERAVAPQDLDRARADVAQSEDADLDRLHPAIHPMTSQDSPLHHSDRGWFEHGLRRHHGVLVRLG